VGFWRHSIALEPSKEG